MRLDLIPAVFLFVVLKYLKNKFNIIFIDNQNTI